MPPTGKPAVEPFERTYLELLAFGESEASALRSAARVWLWHHPGASERDAEAAVNALIAWPAGSGRPVH